MDGWMDGWMDGRMDGWLVWLVGGWVGGVRVCLNSQLAWFFCFELPRQLLATYP